MRHLDESCEQINSAFRRERPRIVGLCTTLSGNHAVAEDLAQETFVEAWRHIERLRDINAMSPWLSAIARNVCLRWRSRRAYEAKHSLPVNDATLDRTVDSLPSVDDVEFELERYELASLLDQALELLPSDTRHALLARYIEESPYAEIAEHFQVSEGAIKMRVKRGRAALFRYLIRDLQHGVDPFVDISRTRRDGWRTTDQWCSICGQKRLNGCFDATAGNLVLRCPTCHPTLGFHEVQTYGTPELFRGIEDLTQAHAELVNRAGAYFWESLARGRTSCFYCGKAATVAHQLPDIGPLRTFDWRGAHVHCGSCGRSSWSSLNGLVLSLPAIQRFRQENPRVRALPEQCVESNGQPALVVRFASQTTSQLATAVVARDTFRVLKIDVAV